MAGPAFRDRRHAGQVLARALEVVRDREDVVVLGLPRGGVPVAFEVARALDAPLDVLVVRKLGVPGHEELAFGALASGDLLVWNDEVVRGLQLAPEVTRPVIERERLELARRELAYRGDRARLDVAHRTVILVDDGLATGATMRAAVRALAERDPAGIVVAVPVAPDTTCRELEQDAVIVCPVRPSPFHAVGSAYRDFTQTTDAEVRELLDARARSRP